MSNQTEVPPGFFQHFTGVVPEIDTDRAVAVWRHSADYIAEMSLTKNWLQVTKDGRTERYEDVVIRIADV